MPSLLSKYRKKRESKADETGVPHHRKGPSESSYESGQSAQHSNSSSAPGTVSLNSGSQKPNQTPVRGLNSPFLSQGELRSQGSQTSPQIQGQKPKPPHQAQLQGLRDSPRAAAASPHLAAPQQLGLQHTPQLAHQSPQQPGSGEFAGTPNAGFQQPMSFRASPNQARGSPQGQMPQQAGPQIGGPGPLSQGNRKKFTSQADSKDKTRGDPWTECHIKRACPSARFGHSANNVAARDGELLIMGGIREMDILDDVWIIDTNHLTGYQVKTEGPYVGPRVGHAALTLGNAYIMLGGDTKIKETDPLDDNLYLLNTSTFKWTIAEPTGPRPCGRYGHSICNIGVKIYVFGGQVDDLFFDDMWMFDLNNLRPPNTRWERIEPATTPPPPRTNHTVVTYKDKMYLFGGANGDLWYSDTWCFDPADNSWTQLDCTGYVPAPCQGHAATIVDDVMYVFGGMSSQGVLIGQLFALKLTTRKWYTFQNLGPGPCARSGHSLTAFDHDRILVWGGTDQSNTAFVLDVSRISYPPDDEEEAEVSVQSEENPMAGNMPEIAPPSVPGPSGVVAETTETTPRDTFERSTPAARNSVIYPARLSWSPHRSLANDMEASALSSAEPKQVPIADDSQEASYLEQTSPGRSLDFDSSANFQKRSLQRSPLDRDAGEMDSSVERSGSQKSPLPKSVPAVDHSGEVTSPNSSKGIGAAIAGAAGAMLWGKKASAESTPLARSPDASKEIPTDLSSPGQELADGMPGAWTQTSPRADSEESSIAFQQLNDGDVHHVDASVPGGVPRELSNTQHVAPAITQRDTSRSYSTGSTSQRDLSGSRHSSLNGRSFSPTVQREYSDKRPLTPTTIHSTDSGIVSASRQGTTPKEVLPAGAPGQPDYTPGHQSARESRSNSPFVSNTPTKQNLQPPFNVETSSSRGFSSPNGSSKQKELNAVKDFRSSLAQGPITEDSDLATALKNLQAEFAAVQENMRRQAQDASRRIKAAEAERDQALAQSSRGIQSGSVAGVAPSVDGEDIRQKHATVQRELFSTKDQHENLLHEHNKLTSEHEEMTQQWQFVRSTLEQQVQALHITNEALEKSRAQATNAIEEAEALRAENEQLKEQVTTLEHVTRNAHQQQERSRALESEVVELRIAHQLSTAALNDHISQLLNHWSNFTATTPQASTSRDLDDSHYSSMYEKSRAAHENTQKELEAAYAEIAELKAFANAGPRVSDIENLKSEHAREIGTWQERHTNVNSELERLKMQFANSQEENSGLIKRYQELESDYSSSLEHFKSQKLALDKTREELARIKEVNTKLEEELQESKLHSQDPDVSVSSNLSNRHAEVMVRGLRARIIVLEEERDELRQKVDKLREAALANAM